MILKRTRLSLIFACGCAAAFSILLGHSPAQAATYYWTVNGSGGSGTWDTSASYLNWNQVQGSAGTAAWSGLATDTAEFYTGSGAVTVNNTQSVDNINFDAGTNYTLSGGAINFTGAITASSNATIYSALSGNGSVAMAGSGLLTLSGNQTYTGLTTISGGTLALDSLSSNFASAVTNNSVLQLTNANALFFSPAISGSGAVAVSGTSVTFSGGAANSDTGTTSVGSGCTLTLSKTGGAVAVAGNLALGAGATSYARVITTQPNQFGPNSIVDFLGASDYYSLYLEGNNQTLAGVIDNSSGRSVLCNGQGGSTALSSATLTFNLSTTNNTFSGTIRDNDSGSDTTTFGLTVSGNGMLTLSGNGYTYTGPTTVSGGTLALSNCTGFSTRGDEQLRPAIEQHDDQYCHQRQRHGGGERRVGDVWRHGDQYRHGNDHCGGGVHAHAEQDRGGGRRCRKSHHQRLNRRPGGRHHVAAQSVWREHRRHFPPQHQLRAVLHGGKQSNHWRHHRQFRGILQY